MLKTLIALILLESSDAHLSYSLMHFRKEKTVLPRPWGKGLE